MGWGLLLNRGREELKRNHETVERGTESFRMTVKKDAFSKSLPLLMTQDCLHSQPSLVIIASQNQVSHMPACQREDNLRKETREVRYINRFLYKNALLRPWG